MRKSNCPPTSQILPKRARSPSPDRNVLSDSEMLSTDLDIKIDESLNEIEKAIFDDQMTVFFIEQLEKELARDFWALEDDVDDLYGVSNATDIF